MRAAIYARRSTEEHQHASLDVQVGEAKRFIAERGWSLDDAHVYQDGLTGNASGGEFRKRPALVAMLLAASAKAFDVVVLQRDDRLGRDVNRTGIVIQDLVDAGVRIFMCATGEELRIDGAIAKFIVAARAFGSELEREKTSARTREHLETKARRGFVTGGTCYGYRNVEVREGERRVRVEYAIDDQQAAIVREVFDRYAAGEGLRGIAKDFNARGIPSPHAGRRGTGSWAASSLRPMLSRDRYVGRLVWGQREKAYRSGTKVRLARAANDWTIVDMPALRIVSDEQWDRVQALFTRRAREGSPRLGPRRRYLLVGVSRCGQCGGRMCVANSRHGSQTIPAYACAYHRERGNTVCTNATRRPVELVDGAVVESLLELLTEEMIVRVVKGVRARIAEASNRSETELPELERQASRLRAEIRRLGEAIVSTATPPGQLVRMMSEREATLSELEAKIATSRTAPSVLDLEVRRLEKEARARLVELRGALQRNPDEARAAVAAVVGGGLVMTPVDTDDGRRFRVEGEVALAVRPGASPAGSARSDSYSDRLNLVA